MRFSILIASLLVVSTSNANAAILTGADAGGGPHVKVFSSGGNNELNSFFAFDPSFTGGVRVAAGDVSGDGVADIITSAGPGGGPHVKVFDGQTGDSIVSFFSSTPSFTGGVYVASDDVDSDGFADIVTGTGAGSSSEVSVFTGTNGNTLWNLTPYGSAFSGGVRVATGDVNGDGQPEVITGAGPGGGPHVKIFSGSTGVEVADFLAYDTGFSGGVYVAAGDINNDGFEDVVTGVDAGGGPHVKVFDGQSGLETSSFFAYDASFTGGVRVAAGDINGDGFADIITGPGPSAGPHVKVFDGKTGDTLQSFFAYDPTFQKGIFVGYAPDPIPEPSTLMLLAIGLAGTLLRTKGVRNRCS